MSSALVLGAAGDVQEVDESRWLSISARPLMLLLAGVGAELGSNALFRVDAPDKSVMLYRCRVYQQAVMDLRYLLIEIRESCRSSLALVSFVPVLVRVVSLQLFSPEKSP